MKITYDPKADAVYFHVAEKVKEPDTHEVGHDIYLDFDARKRLVGIEVLDASKRLDLKHLLPQAEVLEKVE